MKAKYQTPEMEYLFADSESLLGAASVLTDDGEGNISQGLVNAPTTEETSGNLSRRSIWDDEE